MTSTLSPVPVTVHGVVCGRCSTWSVKIRHASATAVRLCYRDATVVGRDHTGDTVTVKINAPAATPVRRPSGTIVGAETQLPNGASVPVDTVQRMPYLPQVPGTVRPVHVSADGARLQEVAMRRPDARPLSLLDVPAGRYAVRGADGVVKFYRVDRPTEGRWAGRVFVKIQAGDELHNVRDSARRTGILSAILAAGPDASSLLYGQELGVCGDCGRTLTDETSRAIGRGPVCRSRH